jgi:hypothetical protein
MVIVADTTSGIWDLLVGKIKREFVKNRKNIMICQAYIRPPKTDKSYAPILHGARFRFPSPWVGRNGSAMLWECFYRWGEPLCGGDLGLPVVKIPSGYPANRLV